MADTEITQKLAAILAADAVGFSRLMGTDERATLGELDANRALFRAHIETHGGRIVDMAGDSVLAVFSSAAGAVHAAVAAQAAIEERSGAVPEERRMRYRIGVNLGEIIEKEDGSIYGDGVNVAARLQSLAEPGGILLSAKVHDEVRGRVDARFAEGGEHKVKNIARPLRTYRVVGVGDPEPARPTAEPPPLPDKPSIVVLPFDNMSGDAEQQYFADGITEDIITDISKVSGMFVIARNSAFSYKGKAVNLTEVGRELGVRHVLEGSVRKAGNRVRITAQLIDAASGGHLWAERYDRDLDDIFAVQDEVTREIVKALRVKLTKDDKARLETTRPTDNLEAYELFLRGRDLAWRLEPGAHLEARRLLSDAVALDGSFVDAIALLGFTYMLDIPNPSEQSRTALDTAAELGARCLALDASRPSPHFLMSSVHLWRREFDEALAAEDRCLALDPNFPQGRAQRGFILHYVGRSAEAIDEIKQAMRLDPLMPEGFLHTLAQCHFDLGDDEEAACVCRRRITIRPNTDISRVLLAAALGHLGRHDEARREWAGARAINPRYSFREKRAILPYRHPAMMDRMAAGLAKAGIDPDATPA